MTHAEILAKFPDQRRGKCRCPAHEDGRASLQISLAANGRDTVMHCHAGCSVEAIIGAAGLTMGDLFDAPQKAAERRIVATYDYRAASGELLYQSVRYEPKDFRQRRPDGAGGWLWTLGDVARVLYHLPDLKGQTAVAIAEGEKDVDALRALGITATCGFGGASKSPDRPKWLPAYTAQLKAAGVQRVHIFEDADEPGRAHALAIARACTAAKIEAAIVALPNLPSKAGADVSDWLAVKGHGVEQLRAAIEAAPIFGTDRPASVESFRNDDTERLVLGDVLTHPAQLEVYRGAGFVGGLFQHAAHPIVWAAIEQLAAREVAPTTEAVRSHLRTTGKLGAHGLTAEYLASLRADLQPQETIRKLHDDLTALVLCRDLAHGHERDLKLLRRDPSRIMNGFLDTKVEQLEALRARRPADPASALLDGVALLEQPDVPWQIAGMIQRRSIVLLSGRSNSAKSHLDLSLSCILVQSKHTALSWFGQFEINPDCAGDVVMVHSEGQHGLKPRLQTAIAAYGLTNRDLRGLHFHRDPLSLQSDEDVAAFIRKLPTGPIAKITLDCWAQMMLPGDENNQRDAGLAVAAVKRIQRAADTTVIVVHHVGVADSRERGSTVLRDAVDTSIRITQLANGVRRVSCDKQRDADYFAPWLFRLEACEPSCFPVYLGDDTSESSGPGDTPSDDLLSRARHLVKLHPQLSNDGLAKKLKGRKATALNAIRKAREEADSATF